MLWDIIFVVILVVASATLYQWGASIWKGNAIPENETKWVSIFLWISATNFIFDALNLVLKVLGVGVSGP